VVVLRKKHGELLVCLGVSTRRRGVISNRANVDYYLIIDDPIISHIILLVKSEFSCFFFGCSL